MSYWFKQNTCINLSKPQYCLLMITIVLILNNLQLKANPTLNLQTGYGYIEHFSTGVGVTIFDRHNISALYGSDFFIKTMNFSAYLLQYEYAIKKDAIIPFTFKTGVKGGYSIYTNKYYRWELLALVPYIGFSYPVTRRFDITASTGVAVSRELSMKRISMGEIGWYKRLLPEFKIAFSYEIF